MAGGVHPGRAADGAPPDSADLAQAPGTLVVAACVEVNRPLGIVPAGTFSYVARNLGLSLAAAPAVAVIVAGHIRRVDVGEINGRVFLNNAGLSLYAQLIEQRERDKRRFGRRRVMAFLSALRFLGRPLPRYAVELVADGQPTQRVTTTLFFGCNARQLEDFQLAAAACVRHRRVTVAVDGELACLRPPLAVQVRVGALQVFAPPVEPGGAG